MEACRKLCGGHGYLSSAGFAEIQLSFLPFCTLEGTKEVLYQQTGRYLLKTLLLQTDKPSANVAYLLEQNHRPDVPFGLPDFDISTTTHEYASLATSLVQVLESRSRHFATLVLSAFQHRLASGLLEGDSFTAIGVELCSCAEYHSHLLVAKSFAAGVSSLESDACQLNSGEIKVMRTLLLLHLVQRILEDSGSFLISNAIPISILETLSKFRNHLVASIAPHALNLIEAYQFSDKRLDSVLGRRDGNVYSSMMEVSRAEPLNHGAAAEGQRYILQMLDSKKTKKAASKTPGPKSRL